MTGRLAAPAAVAALFAVHPLRVESVAWVAERKDVLCATFFMLALLAYAHYAQRPSVIGYLSLLACHALGLMSKTMLVTLPCVLLLLDYWPLRRLRWGDEPAAAEEPSQFPPRSVWWLVVEKLPLLALSLIASTWTVVFQSSGGAMWGYRDLTLGQRAANAVVSVPRYLWNIAWPADLSVFYPHPGSWSAWKIAVAATLVAGLSAGAAALYRRRPYVTVGWFWFLGMLVPVSGFIQVGLQSMADRYTYLPSIGLLVAIAWWLSDWLRQRPRLKPAVALAACLAVAAMSVATWRQQRHWSDTMALFQQALAVDPDNWLAHNTVGTLHTRAGDAARARGDAEAARRAYDTAAAHLRRSVQLNPDHYLTFHNYGWSLQRLGRLEEAAEQYRRSMRIRPEFGLSELHLAITLAQLGRMRDSLPHFERAASLLPDDADARSHWGEALLQQGRVDEAKARFQEALRINPDHAAAKYWLEQATSPRRDAPAPPGAN